MPCYWPIKVPVKTRPDLVQVPCGSCLGCRAEQGRQWAIRMVLEERMHSRSWFVTLTYDDESLPEHGSLYPQDVREFAKSVRRNRAAGSFSYFIAGEYGPETHRPHYHAVLFGLDLPNRVPLPDRDSGPIWWSPTVASHWKHGSHEVADVTFGSAAYVASYVQKKVKAEADAEYYLRVSEHTGEIASVHPEFARMSRNPAIGRRWIEKYWADVYPRDYVVIDGQESKPPRYFDKWAEQDHRERDPSCPCPDHQAALFEALEARQEVVLEDSWYSRKAGEANHRAKLALHRSGTL